jgi:hypothetical protein
MDHGRAARIDHRARRTPFNLLPLTSSPLLSLACKLCESISNQNSLYSSVQTIISLDCSFHIQINNKGNTMDSAEVSTAVNEPLDLVKLSLSELVEQSLVALALKLT